VRYYLRTQIVVSPLAGGSLPKRRRGLGVIALDRHHRVAAVFLLALLADDLTPLLQRLATEP